MNQLTSLLPRLVVRSAFVAGSLAEGRLFWARAALGKNQLLMHDCSPEGEISIGGVSEQLYGEGFLLAFHEVLGREHGERLPEVLYEIGVRGARWEVAEAIRRRVWVPTLLRPFVGKPALFEKARTSRLHHALTHEALMILFRMIMTEGGWGVVEELDVRARPIRLVVRNTPEPRRLGRTGAPSCHLMRGIYAGYFATLSGQPFSAAETTCVARGDARCTFELTPTPAPVTGERVEAETVAAHA
jgi:predicted hydrocarbon binding protein